MKNERVLGSMIVSAVAALAISGLAFADDAKMEGKKTDSHYCQNNSCKGKSDCQGHGNDNCSGRNTCKGKGYKEAKNGKECKKKGGKWMNKSGETNKTESQNKS